GRGNTGIAAMTCTNAAAAAATAAAAARVPQAHRRGWHPLCRYTKPFLAETLVSSIQRLI
ncbi:MAG: hypothetical protein ACR2NO_08180, partial [Chloroflexota bacterium]